LTLGVAYSLAYSIKSVVEKEAVLGDSVGLKVQDRVRRGDEVYKETSN
jgi:hypothetical protein